jgi:hypothetical protein
MTLDLLDATSSDCYISFKPTYDLIGLLHTPVVTQEEHIFGCRIGIICVCTEGIAQAAGSTYFMPFITLRSNDVFVISRRRAASGPL